MPILDDIKGLMRISLTQTAFDSELSDLIAAARSDLMLSGVLAVKAVDDTDSLIKRAVSLYCKANFGWDNPDAGRLMASYDMLKMHLTLSMEYTRYLVTFTVKAGVTLLENAVITFNDDTQITNASGVAIFVGVDPAQNLAYTVTLSGYVPVYNVVDVSGSQAVAVEMGAV